MGTARELFEAARSARPRIEALTRLIDGTGPQGWRHGGITVRPHALGGATSSNPTAGAAIANISATEAARIEREALERLLGDLLAAIEGARLALGSAQADVLELHYLDGYDLQDVAHELGISLSTCYRHRAAALAWVDRVGIAAAKAMGRREIEPRRG